MPNDYEVGYGKPPEHSRFREGQSGNPSGRPKRTRNLKTDLIEELRELVVVREGDRTRKISKQRAVVKSVTARTVKGDMRAASTLLNLILRLLDLEGGPTDTERPLNSEELELLASVKERLIGLLGTDPKPGGSQNSGGDGHE